MEKRREKNKISLKSFAKINLFLDVLAKRPDGYHDIRTIFSEISLYDTLNFILTKNNEVKILTNKYFVSSKNNLIYRVALFIKEKYNVQDSVEVFLEKNIPISAGLGGGSSNAATTIRALSELWDLNLSNSDMHEIAAEFGSDINFFLAGGSALGEGRGEKIIELDDIFLENIFLVKPSFGISSSEAYKSVQLDVNNNNWQELIRTTDPGFCFNKLQKGISKIYPEISEIIEFLENNGAEKAILSGSGSTVIGFCPDKKSADWLTNYYSDKGYWNYITKTKRRSTK
ncbi:4-(cytidine 5'-diphospho)-2-C-methyl-D-erythritol kinase [Candidatus Cloacimonadota bacterium]